MRNTLLWILALVITLSSAVYQRMTGPTHPFRGRTDIAGVEVAYRLLRSAETTEDCRVGIRVSDPGVEGRLLYKRYPTEDPWTSVPMTREGERLFAYLPRQPAAGKLAYKVILNVDGADHILTGQDPLIFRFKDPVPNAALIPHIIIMFLAMLVSTRAGLAALDKRSNPRRFAIWAAALIIVGGFIFGPIVQKYAFGVYWSGFPFGTDLTDNKTALALVAWIAALIAGRKNRPARPWVLAASVVTLLVYLIPHSLLGSELDYSQLD
jgi:ABC-type transport system involved in cytochrome c biogenesis permease subunit